MRKNVGYRQYFFAIPMNFMGHFSILADSEQKRTSSSMNILSNAGASSSRSSGFLPNTLSPIYGLSPFLTPSSSNNVTNERTPRTLVNGNKFNSPAVSRLLGLM